MDEDISMAVQIHQAYRQNMAGVGVVYDRPVMDDMQHWAKAAKLVMRNGLDPVRFVNAQFMVLPRDTRGALTPRMLHSPVQRVLNAYVTTSPTPVDWPRLYARLKSRLDSATGGCLQQQAVLEDQDMPFPAWFRIIAAEELSDTLKKCYLDAARREYESDPGLRSFLDKEALWKV